MKIPEDKRKTGLEIISKKIIQLRRKACKDFPRFRKYYFKDYHKYPDAEFHREVCDMLSAAIVNRGSKIAMAAPRDSGKSTIITTEYVVYCICYKLEDFIVISSSTSDQATDFLSQVKNELEYNRRLSEDFPEICEINEKPKPPRWTQKEIITRNNVKVIALSTGQQIRGRRNRDARPSLIILDDIETNESIQNPESFQKLEDWVTKSVLKAGTNRTNTIYIGTIHHYNSLLAKFTGTNEYPGWNKKIYRSVISWSEHPELWQRWVAIFNHKESYKGMEGPEAALRFFKDHEKKMLKGIKVLWPEKKNYYDLMVIREEESYSSFDSEMQNEPVDLRTAIFTREETHFWTELYEMQESLLNFLESQGHFIIIGACDPSMGRGGKYGNRSAIITLAKDCTSNKCYILDADIAFRKPDKLIDDILAYHVIRNYSAFAFEINQSQQFMADVLSQRSIERGIPLNIHEIRSVSDKIARIQSLQPFVKSGTILFSDKHVNLLEEMRFFPKGRFDDGLDALQMAYEISRNVTGGSAGYPQVFQLNSIKYNKALNGVPDPRPCSIPRVYNEKKDRFVPPGNGPKFLIFRP